jgi:hypothetical protein
MKKKIFFCFLILSAFSLCYADDKKFIKEKDTIKKEFLKEKDRNDILKVFNSTPEPEGGLLNNIAKSVIFDIKGNPFLVLPIVNTSKDLGIDWGFMPVLMLKGKNDSISSVIAPSITKNADLGYTYAYRHYFFPTEKSLIVARGYLSEHVQREVFFHYYNPEILGSNIRLNAELRDWHNPKSSFYGYGIDSKKSNGANYTYYLKGGEFSLSLPLFKNVYFDYTPSYYQNKAENGIFTNKKFSDSFPVEYSMYNSYKSFFTNRFSILFDNTDHPFIPKIGTYFIFSGAFSKKGLLSDYDYSIYTLELKDYYNYKLLDKSITAVRFLLQWQTGDDIPFYNMPQLGESTGLREAGDGRFVDRAKMVLNIEQRFTIVKQSVMKFLTELEVSPFIDIGTVAPSLSKISTGDLKYGPGLALRIVLRPQIVGTAEFAFGSEGMNTIVKINYPF